MGSLFPNLDELVSITSGNGGLSDTEQAEVRAIVRQWSNFALALAYRALSR